MIQYGYTSDYLTKDSEPWFPIMGEIHYSRYPQARWKEEILKMKAGGVNVVSTYVFWLHHEEREGIFRFDGQRDVGRFIREVDDCGLKLVLRIGPWCHGEARNGGFPDWLMQKPFKLRQNDPKYLEAVERLWKKVFEQVEGLFHKDGGPIIGIQIENEYGHVGGLNGPEGEQHMEKLTALAKEIGFITPIYTATGWGGAVTGGLIPVMGGYCEAPWDQRLTKIEPSGNYVFSHERNDSNIGSDHAFGTGITYDIEKFPFLTAELGGGLQVTHHRRPIVNGDDIGAMSMTKLGSGVNLLGYYMYHGGSNPKGELSTLQESRATGYPNDVPEISYDFQAPVGEFGQIQGPFRTIKRLAMFIADFGQALCRMKTVLPEDNPTSPKDLESLRRAYRHDGKSGYMFVNNYQRVYSMADHPDVRLSVELKGEIIEFPETDIKDGDYFFYPFRMTVGDGLLECAAATPLCRLNEDCYVFYTDQADPYRWTIEPTTARVLTISCADSLKAFKVEQGGREHLIITDALILQAGEEITALEEQASEYRVYPPFEACPRDMVMTDIVDGIACYRFKSVPERSAVVEWKAVKDDLVDDVCYRIEIDMNAAQVHEAYLTLDYEGDQGALYLDGEKIADHFYTGVPWQIGLSRFDFPKQLELKVKPLKANAPIYLEKWPPMTDGQAASLKAATIICQTERRL